MEDTAKKLTNESRRASVLKPFSVRVVMIIDLTLAKKQNVLGKFS